MGLGIAVAALALAASAPETPGTVWVDRLDLAHFSQRRGVPRAGKAVGGGPLSLGGTVYAHGVGTRSISEYVIALHGNARRFRAVVGLDDSADAGKREGTVRFQLWADERLVADSGVMAVGAAPKPIEADLAGAATLTMRLDDGGDTSNGDLADWADARIELVDPAGAAPEPYRPAAAASPALAPPDDALALHGPAVLGTTPGKPFLYRVPATGAGRLLFAAAGLPRGLAIDRASGIIHGVVRAAGRSAVMVNVSDGRRRAARRLWILAGPRRLARTPPMGWNSWNVWGTAVDDAKVRAAAAALISSGLAAHGYDMVVIDDAWAGDRGPDGEIRPNAKFPDMKALTDYVHQLGLRIGIYSSPGPKTCGGYAGSYRHEAQDAATFARWGFDYLKYDWCSYDEVAPDHSLAELEKPYALIGAALAASPRDIVYSLCQYGYGDVWKWGAAVGGNLWRTTGDLLDTWANLDSVGFRQAGRERFSGPGHWGDTDMLVVGPVGWGPDLHPTRLKPDEQVLHMTLWAMQAAPLFIGADLERLDGFTRALLMNDEVLDVDRDVLGHAAGRLWARDRLEIWARPLADGTYAVALFNRGLAPRPVRIDWARLGLSGAQPVRDLWRRIGLGRHAGGYAQVVPSHGAMLLKIGSPR